MTSTVPGAEQPAPRKLPERLGVLMLGFTVAVATLGVFGFLAEDVYEHEAIRLDAQANTTLHGYATPRFDALMEAASFIGSAPVLLALLLGAVIWLWLAHHPREAVFLAVALGGGAALNTVLKAVFQRPRPALPWSVANPTYSFPSGHSMSSLVFFLGVALVVWVLAGPRWGGVAFALASVIVLTIGVSRIYLGYHYFSDVIGGYSAGLCWLSATALAFEGRHYRPRQQTLPAPQVGRATR